MAIAAGEIVAREPCVPISCVRSYIGIGHGNEVAPVPHKPAGRIIRQCVNVGDGPDRGACLVILLVLLLSHGCGGEERAEHHRRGEAYADESHTDLTSPNATGHR